LKPSKKLRRLVRRFLAAQRAGVIVTLRDWDGLSFDERVAWLAALELRAHHVELAKKTERTRVLADPEPDAIRAALTAAAERTRARAGA
jgi:hypothetical protein